MEVESGNGIERVVGQRRDGKRVYDERFKQAVLEQCLAGESSVASIALSHGIDANLVCTCFLNRCACVVPLENWGCVGSTVRNQLGRRRSS